MRIKKSHIITNKKIQKKEGIKIKTRKNDQQTKNILENYDTKSENNMTYNTISYSKQKIDNLHFSADDRELRAILYDGQEKYKIPRYQRPYSWTNDQVSDLWNDLTSGESAFLGSFVLNYERYEEEHFVEVIDGQQRLITLTILIAVIRDKYKELGQNEEYINAQGIIARKDPASPKVENRLKCGDSLNNFFSEYIQKKDSNILVSKPKTKEEKLIKSNYEFIRDKISEQLNQYNKEDKIKYLQDLIARIFCLKIILIKIENEDDAYSIFETVNARGADLTAADLLKNYLFSKLPTTGGEDTAKDIWSNIENNVESAKGPLNVSKFIRYFWLSSYSFVPEKKLYKEIKKEIKGDPKTFLQELQKASVYYYKIANDLIGPEDWLEDFQEKKAAQKINEALAGLRIMGITQCYSLVLCLLMNKDKIGYDFSEIFKVIEKYHFAYSAVCKLSGNIVERVYFNTAKEIREAIKSSNGKENIIRNVQRVLSKFEQNLSYPPKTLFKEKFLEIEYKNYQLVVYVLSNIEKALSSQLEEKTLNFSKVNIEHILPQDPSQWSLTKKEVKNYVNMLGNLTLIAKKINGSVGNKKLREKIDEFKRSDLEINKKLVKEFEELKCRWGEKEIIERQEKLADLAYEVVWKFRNNQK
jgi:uncharacterized protein with ParB-like and HNH nuclease domain